jgi:hypothetical protein
MSATVWGTNLYDGEPVGDFPTTIMCGKYSRISHMDCQDGVRILADPSSVFPGDVFVENCMFRGRVQYTGNVRFENCYFRAGKPELWTDPFAATP